MEKIPYHIHAIATLYLVTPLSDALEPNLADGRIENWGNLVSDKHEFPKSGAPINLTTTVYLNFKTKYYSEIWIHLGSGYVKQVIKRQINPSEWKTM